MQVETLSTFTIPYITHTLEDITKEWQQNEDCRSKRIHWNTFGMLHELRVALIDRTSSTWRHELRHHACPTLQVKEREERTMIEVIVKWTWEEDVMTQGLVLNALSSIINFSAVGRLNGAFFRNSWSHELRSHYTEKLKMLLPVQPIRFT